MPSPNNPKQVKNFIQITLGCSCPDSVFAKQELDSVIVLGGNVRCKKLCIGEKLLIYLVDTGAISDLQSSISTLISEGRKERDSRNLNRFRLVLGAEDVDAVSKEAEKIYGSIDDLDNKTHIHILSSREVEKIR